MPQTCTKTLSYKLACDAAGNAINLQTLLQKAFDAAPRAVARIRSCGPDDGDRMFINQHSESDGMLFGAFCAFEPGRHQPVLDYNALSDVLPIEAIEPPQMDGEKGKIEREFLDSILYFGIRKAHLILAQSHALRSVAFESYVNWFVTKTTATSGSAATTVLLNDQVSPDIRKRVNKARGISMWRPVEFTTNSAPAEGGKPYLKPTGTAWKAIAEFMNLNNPFLPDNLRLKNIIGDAQIRATLDLQWRYKRDDDDTPLLDEIANVLRHEEGGVDYSIDMGKYGTLTKKELKLSTSCAVDVAEGKIDERELHRHMREWLTALIKKQSVMSDPC